MMESPFHPPDAPSVLPRGPHGLDPAVVLASQRGRLLTAFVDEASAKGYATVTIQDIVTRAGTAKPTFYEHFRDKEDCFAQAFDVGTSAVIAAIVDRAGPVEDPIERIEVGVRAYLEALAAVPAFTRVLLTDVMSAGPRLAEHWMVWTETLAGALVNWRRDSRARHPEMPALTRLHALAVISGINEVACMTVHREGVDGLAGITRELTDLAVALLTADTTRS